MRVDVTTEIIVAKPPGVVAAVAVKPGNLSKWYAGIESVVENIAGSMSRAAARA